MKKYLILFIVVTGTNLFADEMIVNGGFDMSPWDTGWTNTVEHIGGVKQCDTTYCSSSRSCFISVVGYIPSGPYSKVTMSQTIKPTTSCTCTVMLKYREIIDYSTFIRYISISVTINGKDTTIHEIPRNYGGEIGENMVWTQFRRGYTDKDTITRIKFLVYVESPTSSSYMNKVYLWIDDVSIAGAPVVGIEEPSQGSLKPPLQALDFKIIKNKISLSLPNDYYPNILLTIYDLSGRPKETVYSGTLSKGDYTFTPSIKKSGVYFVRLSTNDFTETKKLVLIK
ncbi:MAG: T9SS type A sorting domain-containing protein [bacterium]